MSFINVYVTKGCDIKIENNKLIICGEKVVKYPIEDVNCLMIESNQVSITSYAIQKLSTFDVVIFFCNDKHLPNTICTPYQTHYKRLFKLRLQIEANKPRQNRLWQSIIKQKIINQATCLKLLGNENYKQIYELSKNVQSRDNTNIEALSAKMYFKELGGENFNRQEENILNGALNYTYAIVRGVIARALVCHGYETSIGIFHKNQYNNFNLADDLIEVFRGIVDYYVKNSIVGEEYLTTSLKAKLFNILNIDVLMKNERHSLSYSIEKMVASLDSYYENGEEVILPHLVEIKMHQYE